MRIIKPTLIALVAICFAVSGTFARDTKSSGQSKSASSSASAKKKKSASGRSAKKSAKSRSSKRGASQGHFNGFAEELPKEELPVMEEPEADSE